MTKENKPLNDARNIFLNSLIDKIIVKDPTEWQKHTRKWEYDNNYGYNEDAVLTNYHAVIGKLFVSIDRTRIEISTSPVEPGITHEGYRNEKSEEWQIRLYEGTNLREWLVWSRYQNKGDIKRLIEYFTPKTRDSDTSNRETEHFANLEELTK